MNRRDLIHRVIIGGTLLVVAPSLLESCTKSSAGDTGGPNPGKIVLDLSLPAYSTLVNSGGSLIVQDVIVLNSGGGNFSALSSICTHQGCTVGYNPAAGNIQCPCHGSVYSTSGSVINGPAPTALRSYQVSLSGNILTITL